MLRRLLGVLVVFSPAIANATDVSVKLEPGVAVPLSAPQSERFDTGGTASVKVLFGLNRYLDIGPATSFMLLPASQPGTESATVWTFGGGLRLKRPHDAVSAYGISPWLDADVFYVRTGALDRPGFDAALGLSIPIGEARTFWVGPFIRYLQVIQLDRDGFDNRDAKTLIFGISFEAGTGIERKPADVHPVVETRVVTQDRMVCPDRDADGLPDDVDHCPDIAGPIDNWGCPTYQKVIVHADKLELKEKIQFAWNTPKLEEASFPLLDEVARVLKDNPNFHVAIEGHASSEGADDHNQTLSDQRASAVLDYLVAHGVPRERLGSAGFSSSVPIDTNRTSAGRENNRRVEFVVTLNIVKAPGSSK